MATSHVRVHDCFDVLAGESKPPRCKCPTRVSPEVAQALIASGKAKSLNSWAIVSLLVRNPAARAANPKALATHETEQEFIQAFRKLSPKSQLSDGEVLEIVKNPERFKESDAHAASNHGRRTDAAILHQEWSGFLRLIPLRMQ